MKCKITPLLFLALMILCNGCKKAYDYIEQNPFATCDACKVNQIIVYTAGTSFVYNVTYDKKDRMTKMVTDEERIGAVYNFYFRYDNKNRLTDYIKTHSGSDNATEWRTYQYYPNKITDTFYIYWGGPVIGTSSDPAPSPDFPSWAKILDIYSLDSKGRITQRSLVQGANSGITNFTYNASNNLVYDPPALYDNKINPYRTNPVWQLTQCDYSVNNAYYLNDGTVKYHPKPTITKYNAYGLPTKYVVNDYNANGPQFGISFYDSLEVIYDCDLSNVKIK
ncbi:hypothetical protein [Pinibacter soli]|uniref:DUF4595 domain-containing protein n=1 Tax=Pinibacter soli TaxID=3044211 RepID=A0ABT6RFW4_9BACT|nr:hypothetical protein [Pinibacter soli]MDI3321459.1 hypothetical protein [Pinibacter soli]